VQARKRWPLPAEAEVHISAELNRGGHNWVDSGKKNFKINCPFFHVNKPDSGHNLEITKDGRMAHCWVCDWSGSWNKLAKEVGLSPFGSSESTTDTYTAAIADTDVFGRMLDDLDSSADDDLEHTLPEDEITPWSTKKWRGLRRSFLKDIPAYSWKQKIVVNDKDSKSYGKVFYVDRILWPYHQQGRLVGYVGRRLDTGDTMKYYRAAWCKAKEALFPYDFVKNNYPKCTTVVLVEGEVDALNLLQAGIPALSILGSNNWSSRKVDLLLSLGVTKVFLLMDGDFAGRKAAKAIKKSARDYFDVVVLKLDDGDDPGEMNKDQLAWLTDRIDR